MSILEPTSVDPYRAQEIEGVGVVKQLFAGLVASSPRGQLIPAAAASWERADDGLTWIFRLRGDSRFSTGEPVDAESFVRGVNRALDPAADTETSYHADKVAHGDNEGRYVSADFDAAVDRARSLRDDAARAAAWREAERIALADAALIPLWYRTEHRVVAADRFSGIDLDFFGNPTLAEAAPADAGQAPTGT